MKLKINGVEHRASSNWTIAEKVGNPTMSQFSVVSDEKPHAGDVVEMFTDEDECIFFGIIGMPESPRYSSEHQTKLYSLRCTNGNSILQRRIANVSYTNKTMTEIVNDLYVRYIAGEGITLGTISEIDNPVFEKYNCKNMNLMSVLNELAGYINAVWQVTDDKVFNFVKIEDFPRCSQDVTLDNASFGELTWKEDAQNIRTNQIIDGAKILTDPQTEQVTVTADWEGFDTIFPISAQPRIFINDTEVPQDAIGIIGLDAGNPDILFYWSYESTRVAKNDSYTGSISVNVGDTVKIIYVGIVPIRYEVVNTEKVQEIADRTGLSGYIDNVDNDPTITTRQDALNKANGLLLQYGDAKNTIRCTTDIHSLLEAGFLSEDIDLYRQWRFDIPELDISGDYVLTEKEVRPLRYNEDDSISVVLTFSDRNYIQSYGEVLSRLYQDITKLSVRADEIVIYDSYLNETLGLSEELVDGETIPLWVASVMLNGQIAQPLGTILPNLCNGGGKIWMNRWIVYATINDTGEVCSPYLGDEQYLCSL